MERRFSFVDGDVRMVGVFDRIDVVDGRGTIIDYKTSSAITQEQADKRAVNSLQLILYAMAYRSIFGELPSQLELRFLTPEIVVGTASATEKTLTKAREQIAETAEGIRAGRFPGEPAYQACRYCAYAAICPARRSD